MIDGHEILIADIPGLIEGASEGVGLGTKFLKHIERCSVLIHLIDGTEENLIETYRTIRRELEKYGAHLIQKPELIAINKCDSIPSEDITRICREFKKEIGKEPFIISAVAGTGLTELLRAANSYVTKLKEEEEDPS